MLDLFLQYHLEIFRNDIDIIWIKVYFIHIDKYLNEIGGDTMPLQKTFKALSDPTRREILNLLKNGKMSAGEIADKFDMTQATISHHLSILKKADLITEEKQWKHIYYELNISVFEEIMMWLSQFNIKGGKPNEQ